MKHSYYEIKVWFLPVLCVGIAFLHGLFLYSASSSMDDVYITYWVAKTLSNFGTIINYNGEVLEQSSSLLHVIILAVLHRLSGISLPNLGIYFSALMGGLTMLAAWRLACFLKVRSAWFVVLFCAWFPYLVYWSFTGLETTLVAFITVLLVYSTIRLLTEPVSLFVFLSAVLLSCAYIVTRPEAVFVMLAFLIGIAFYLIGHNILLKKRNQLTYGKTYYAKIAILIGINLAFFTLLSLWRYNHFGYMFPQPVYAKASGIHLERSIQGIEYLLEHFWIPSLVILMVLAVFTLYRILSSQTNERKRVAFVTIISFIVATFAFIVTSGGDWMMGGRFLVPILPLLVILGIYSITKLPKQMSRIVLIFLVLIATFDTLKFFKSNWTIIPLPLAKSVYSQVLHDFELSEKEVPWFERATREHLRDLPVITMLDTVIERLLATHQQTPLTIFSGQMGITPFYIAQKYFGKVRFLDRFALTTTDFTLCPVTRHLYRGKYGIQLSLWYFLQLKFDEIQNKCLLQRPAIIYNLFKHRKGSNFEFLEKNGYKIVYVQFGKIATGVWLGQKKKNSDQYIAVRNDLVPLIGELNPSSYKWPTVRRSGKWSW